MKVWMCCAVTNTKATSVELDQHMLLQRASEFWRLGAMDQAMVVVLLLRVLLCRADLMRVARSFVCGHVRIDWNLACKRGGKLRRKGATKCWVRRPNMCLAIS